VIKVGLTGGIGSGKSEVARLLASHGAVVIDADALAREAVAPGTTGLARVVEEFGADILHADGTLDRARLGAIVFDDPGKLAKLNAIVHPFVGRRSRELMAAAPPDAVVVYDVPLLVESHLEDQYDVVVVVDVSPEMQVRRVADARGLTEAGVRARMANQASRDQRRTVADVVIDNNGDLPGLRAAVHHLWSQLRARAAAADDVADNVGNGVANEGQER
jgi:dephospho-CoA kinase